jgi:hypothetical protein
VRERKWELPSGVLERGNGSCRLVCEREEMGAALVPLLLQKGGERWPGAEVGTLGAVFVLPGALLAKGKAKLWLVSGEGKWGNGVEAGFKERGKR